jgi:hypothetical protein
MQALSIICKITALPFHPKLNLRRSELRWGEDVFMLLPIATEPARLLLLFKAVLWQ